MAAINFVPAFGIHHSFTSHGLTSFFHNVVYRAVCNVVHDFQTDQSLRDRLALSSRRGLPANPNRRSCRFLPLRPRSLFCCLFRLRSTSISSVTKGLAIPAIVPYASLMHSYDQPALPGSVIQF